MCACVDMYSTVKQLVTINISAGFVNIYWYINNNVINICAHKFTISF